MAELERESEQLTERVIVSLMGSGLPLLPNRHLVGGTVNADRRAKRLDSAYTVPFDKTTSIQIAILDNTRKANRG